MKIKSYMFSIMKDKRKTLDAYIIKAFLSLASLIYLILLRCVYFFYKTKILRSHKVPAKVISVGNITLGGTGKTPFSIVLAEYVRAMGKKPAVLHRGYGDDESHLLKERLKNIPVLIGKDRVKNAREASGRLGSDCIILDDGFQHYRIKRDLDIVLIDMTAPFGNMKLFPRGILREPLTRLKDADIAILTKSDMGDNNISYIRGLLKRLNDKIEIAESFYQPIGLIPLDKRGRRLQPGAAPRPKVVPARAETELADETIPLSYISNKKVALLAGIANPDYFDWKLSKFGAQIAERFYYPDHYPYSARDAAYIVKTCLAKGVDTLITTEKDVARLKKLKNNIPQQIEIFALKIDCRINSNKEAILDRLRSVLEVA